MSKKIEKLKKIPKMTHEKYAKNLGKQPSLKSM